MKNSWFASWERRDDASDKGDKKHLSPFGTGWLTPPVGTSLPPPRDRTRGVWLTPLSQIHVLRLIMKLRPPRHIVAYPGGGGVGWGDMLYMLPLVWEHSWLCRYSRPLNARTGHYFSLYDGINVSIRTSLYYVINSAPLYTRVTEDIHFVFLKRPNKKNHGRES